MGKLTTVSGRATVQDVVQQIKQALDQQWIPHLYSKQIRPLRTRRYQLNMSREASAVQISDTLLGVELKVGRRRIMLPDWATARYLSVFARIGLQAVAVPYDITHVSRLADQLETAWQHMMRLVEQCTQSRSKRFASLVNAALIRSLRQELNTLGAGQPYPSFATTTKVYTRRRTQAGSSP